MSNRVTDSDGFVNGHTLPLIGARVAHPQLFAGIAWGTSTVLAETRARIAALERKVADAQMSADNSWMLVSAALVQNRRVMSMSSAFASS